MNTIFKPVFLGVSVYIASAFGLWFVMPLAFSSRDSLNFILLAVTVIPLSLSGYVGAKYTASGRKALRISIGVLAAVTGLTVVLLLTTGKAHEGATVVIYVVAAYIAGIGAFVGARKSFTL